ncbi:response regulator [Luteibacter sp. UNCMF366Tsu5.1]|uniref:response regulator n=1 Tax=Luteibacter sp. UNCMF366Tsu5.1 TaxID=1502758 RepID=UPI000908B962|nr:response regulator [Luteibacter sp. UNCMF366Tsu5.1]SFW23116.1 Transcriptional regulatory protein, C terminal [Luteibacter sp. UNCMF366Tsu5.1]
MLSTQRQGDRLLIVDDEADVRSLLSRYFTAQGFDTVLASDGEEMRQRLAEGHIDLVLLDLGLPGEDGLAITHYLRETWRGPVVIVTGRGDAGDRVVGLELGADDYVTKPFDLRELLARVRSVLRRARGTTAPPAPTPMKPENHILSFEGFALDTRARVLNDPHGQPVDLTSGEYALLRVLVDHANEVLSRDQLMSHLYGREAGPFDRAIDVQIGRLRRKIEPDALHPRVIKSVRGAGYIFTPKVVAP